MNKFLMCLVFVLCCSTAMGNEWTPYRASSVVVHAPIQLQLQAQPVQYPITAIPVVVPLWVPFVPVVTYESVLVEHKQWCLFNRYEIVNIPKVQYVPAKY